MYMGTSDALFKGLIAVEQELRQLHSGGDVLRGL